MLVITVDLLPGGYAPMRRTIAAMSITNISDLAEISDYRVEARARPAIRLPALHRAPFDASSADTLAHNRCGLCWRKLWRRS
jgi:hypothetical protein